MHKDTQALKSRLRNSFMLVGLSERLDDFACLLCRMMGCPPGFSEMQIGIHAAPKSTLALIGNGLPAIPCNRCATLPVGMYFY